VTAATAGYALSIGRSRREAFRVGLAVLTGQLAIGWQNDFVDASRDRRAGRRDKPIVAGDVPEGLVGAAAGSAAVACVVASLANGRRAGLLHLLALSSAASYNAGLKATVASPLPYALSFSLLPAFARRAGCREAPAAPWASAAAGALGVAAHLVNVLPDRELDRSLGVLGLPQRLEPTVDLGVAGALLGLSSALISFGPSRGATSRLPGLACSLSLCGAVIGAARSSRERTAFRLVLLLALLDVVQLLLGASRNAPR
jgi:4-hydroxybenzoate polyprenyltransferase